MDSTGTFVTLACVVLLALPALVMMGVSALFVLGALMQAAWGRLLDRVRRQQGFQGSRLAG
ncbi:MAG: hypothetical protein AAFS10_18385 [Myxococcota bacterium]